MTMVLTAAAPVGIFFVTTPRRHRQATACKQFAAYAMGWRVAQDCDLGLTMAHNGGYLGYGSYVMLMPEFEVGVFVMANRIYAGPSAPAWDSAVAMQKSGLLKKRDVPVSSTVVEMHEAARNAYTAVDVRPLGGNLSKNFVMDRSEENWAAELAGSKNQVGKCQAVESLKADTAIAGNYCWACERAQLEGEILLTLTTPATI